MKKLITKDTITEVNAMLTDDSAVFERFEMTPGTRFCIGNITLTQDATGWIIILPEFIPKGYLTQWKQDAGGYLNRDLKKHNYENLFVLEANGKSVLLRKISEEELPTVKEAGLAHVSIGDYNYMIIRIIRKGETFGNTIIGFFDDDEGAFDYLQRGNYSEYDEIDSDLEDSEGPIGSLALLDEYDDDTMADDSETDDY